jgi:N-acetyl-anhydromuramyl-L-alanine amidase AmpD
MRHINLIVIHCTASPNGRPVSVQTVTEWHKARGFQTIGYHYLIGVDGIVGIGRPVQQMGAHAQGHNATSIGVCMVGGTGGADKLNPGQFTPAQWDSLKIVVQDLMDAYPDARVVGHRDLSPDLDGDGIVEPQEWIKLCPAFDVRGWLADDMTPRDAQVLRAGAAHA